MNFTATETRFEPAAAQELCEERDNQPAGSLQTRATPNKLLKVSVWKERSE